MNSSLQSKIEASIATIQRAAKLAQNYTGKPLVVAFSGGKDSQTVYHLMEAARYSVQPLIIPACAVNAPHRRDRVWFLAKRKSVTAAEDAIGDGRNGSEWQSRAQGGEQRDAGARDDERVLRAAADAVSERRVASDARPVRTRGFKDFPSQPHLCLGDDGLPFGVADAPVYGEPQHGRRRWESEALKALGNAWVPQVAAEIFAAIVQDIRDEEKDIRK